jgi:ribosomal protein L3 glutamine methyltransferase
LDTPTDNNPPRTVRELIHAAEMRFNEAALSYGHGTDNALDEAVWLVMYALGLPLDGPLDPYLEDVPSAKQVAAIESLVSERIRTRKPAAYLTREAWFAGLPFYVDERVLVPRSPLAELIQDEFLPWREGHPVARILDLCTGSGCIGIACAHAFPEAEVDLADISTAALDVAHINIERHGVSNRVHAIESDVFDGLKGRMYDIIVSNPPYVDAEDMAALSEEFRHEPALGLEAGPEGLDVVRRILRDAAAHLIPKGLLVVEVGNSMHALAEALPEMPFTWLEFEFGGEGVFLLTREQLVDHADAIQAFAARGN